MNPRSELLQKAPQVTGRLQVPHTARALKVSCHGCLRRCRTKHQQVLTPLGPTMGQGCVRGAMTEVLHCNQAQCPPVLPFFRTGRCSKKLGRGLLVPQMTRFWTRRLWKERTTFAPASYTATYQGPSEFCTRSDDVGSVWHGSEISCQVRTTCLVPWRGAGSTGLWHHALADHHPRVGSCSSWFASRVVPSRFQVDWVCDLCQA